MKNWVLFRFPNQTDIHFISCKNAKELSNIDGKAQDQFQKMKF